MLNESVDPRGLFRDLRAILRAGSVRDEIAELAREFAIELD